MVSRTQARRQSPKDGQAGRYKKHRPACCCSSVPVPVFVFPSCYAARERGFGDSDLDLDLDLDLADTVPKGNTEVQASAFRYGFVARTTSTFDLTFR